MAESRQFVRVSLYGCSHRPKFSGMSHPKKGETITCYGCRRDRIVMGVESGWKFARARCFKCPWQFASETAGQRKLKHVSLAHANAWGHKVLIENEGMEIKILPDHPGQLTLIDNLELPEPVIKP